MKILSALLAVCLVFGVSGFAGAQEAEGPYDDQLSKFPRLYDEQKKADKADSKQQEKVAKLKAEEARRLMEAKQLEEGIVAKSDSIQSLKEKNEALAEELAVLQKEYQDIEAALEEQKKKNEVLKEELEASIELGEGLAEESAEESDEESETDME